MQVDDLEGKVRNLLRTELDVDDTDVKRDTELVTTGLIDSVGLVRLVGFIERLAGITVPNREITVENFGTLARIEAYVLARLERRT